MADRNARVTTFRPSTGPNASLTTVWAPDLIIAQPVTTNFTGLYSYSRPERNIFGASTGRADD